MPREPLNLKRPLFAARDFRFAGLPFAKGDPFPIKDFSPRLIKRQYETYAIEHHDDDGSAESDQLIQMTGPKGGRYTITAPWLEEPLVVRGKKNADDKLAEMREAGPPEGWGEDDSDPESENDQIEPVDGHAASVLISIGEDDKHIVTAPWLDEPETFDTAEAAEARQTELREAGPPEGWEPPADDQDEGEGEQANARTNPPDRDGDGKAGGSLPGNKTVESAKGKADPKAKDDKAT